MQALKKDTLRALLLVVVMTIVCGLAFPLLMTGVSQLLFRDKANGSIIEADGKNTAAACWRRSLPATNTCGAV